MVAFITLLGALLSAAAAVPLQAIPVSDPGRVVRVTAIVTDSRARPVLDLGVEDFEVTEDEVPQVVDTAIPKGERLAETREPAPRVFGLLLDEFHVSAGSDTVRTREALSRFVREGLRPSDLLAVVKPMDSLTSIRFSRDRERALKAIASFEGRKSDLTPRTPTESRLMGQSPALVTAGRARVVASALRELAAQMAQLRNRHGAIALVSDGFAPQNRPMRPRLTEVQTAIRVALHADIPIYTFSPAGPPGPPPEGAASTPDAQDRDTGALRTLAVETGGLAFLTGGDVEAGLRRVARDLDASYVLTYRPSRPDDGTFRTVSVRVTHPGVDVRTKSGYWAPLASGTRASDAASYTPPTVYRVSRPVRRSPLVETFVGFSRGADGRVRVALTWEPASGPPARRSQTDPAAARVEVRTPDDTPLFDGRIGSVRGAQDQAMPRCAIFEIPPGLIEIDVTLLDANGAVVDSDLRDLEVPQIGGGRPMMLAPEVIRARNAREFDELSADPDAPPSPSRQFSRRERLLIRVPAYASDGSPLTVKATVQDRLGHPMREFEPMPERSRDGIAQFDVPLAWLAPDEYQIELSATSHAGDLQAHIRFRLTS